MRPSNPTRLALSATAIFLATARCCPATPAPYVPDASTLHLWHLDEPHTPALSSVPNAKPLLSLHNGAVMGVTGAPGFGTCLRTATQAAPPANIAQFHGGILLAAPRLTSGPGDNVTPPFTYSGDDGAFTMEAIVKLDVMPENLPTHAAMILSMDDDDINIRRIFHFRIEKSGHLSFAPLPGAGTRGGAYARIPNTGSHAVRTDTWFHVAVTYDGNAGSTDNMRLYWTRLDSGVSEANAIGTGTMSDDFNGDLGDFAIGNESRQFRGNGESEPFPGCIDEVRISSVARGPGGFVFSGSDVAPRPEQAEFQGKNGVATRIDSLKVDGKIRSLVAHEGEALRLGAGVHRLDFQFSHITGPASGPVKVRYQLDGAEEDWKETARGMFLMCQFLDGQGRVLSQSVFPAFGTSSGWEGTIDYSTLLPRREPLMVPEGAASIRVTISSGAPDTTGTLVIDDLTIHAANGSPGTSASVWRNPDFSQGTNLDQPGGIPSGWKRGGNDPSIARLSISPGSPSLSLVDGGAGGYGDWVCTQPLDKRIEAGRTLIVSWLEAYNIIEGQQHEASYLNVPPGDYVFRATAITLNGTQSGSSSLLRLHIPRPITQQPWFGPVLAGGLVTLIAGAAVMSIRQRTRARLQRLRMQNELERDRTRIAQDMHDDLGTVATAITMTASLARRNLHHNPAKADEHLETVCRSARTLVTAMDELVWAVDPANDTLDELGLHLIRLVEEMFTDSGIRHRIRIPEFLPKSPLGSETRHHLALAVKEALHNVLQHSSASEVQLSLELLPDGILIEVRDNGKGFTIQPGRGHGLGNMEKRLSNIGGTCNIQSTPEGTTVRFKLPLPHPAIPPGHSS